MANDQILEVNINKEAKPATHLAIRAAIQELFEVDIKGAAIEGSPVKRGTNRRSIDVLIEDEVNPGLFGGQQTKASIFTQSGYGGYLELGTRYIQAYHYLYNAVTRNMGKLGGLVRRHVKEIK